MVFEYGVYAAGFIERTREVQARSLLTKTMRITAIVCAGSLLLPGAAIGKCGFAKYQVKGMVTLPAGVEAANVRVYLFLEGMNHPSDYPPPVGQRHYAALDAARRFTAEAWMNTSSGHFLRRYGCRRVVRRGDLFIVGEGVEPQRIPVRFDQTRREIRRHSRATAKIPEIRLEPQEEQEAPRY